MYFTRDKPLSRGTISIFQWKRTAIFDFPEGGLNPSPLDLLMCWELISPLQDVGTSGRDNRRTSFSKACSKCQYCTPFLGVTTSYIYDVSNRMDDP